MTFLSSPREAFHAGFYRDARMDFAVRGLLGRSASGATEPGEIFTTLQRIPDGDHAAWFGEWRALGRQLSERAAQLRVAGHFDSAASTFLRASSYSAAAMSVAGDDIVVDVFREHRQAWEGFVETTVYSVERVEIPYAGMALPGFLVQPSDDDEVRPTLIVNGGISESLDALWADAAQGALRRGYSVLFFDGPGQQSMLFERELPLRPDWEVVVAAVVDFLSARDDVDPDKIAIYGAGAGGHLVARALVFEKRIAAAVLDPGIVDLAARWTSDLSAPLARLLADGEDRDRDRFDRDREIALRFDGGAARAWAADSRPFRAGGPFDTVRRMQEFSLQELAGSITTPLLITSAEDEQFWPGQSTELASLVSGECTVQVFTAEEGANFHGQPLARALTEQRIFDWLDTRLGL